MTLLPTPESGPPVPVPPPLSPDEKLRDEIAALDDAPAEKRSGTTTLIVTGALFLGAGGLSWGWSAVVMLAAAIAIHELGHVIAMRLFGYKNVRMLFVPLFGGLATGQPSEYDATRHALVALAGPLVGLLAALFLAVGGVLLQRPAWVGEFAWISVCLNAFNLLPFVPLDGGRVANDTLFSRYPTIETIFRTIAVAALGWLAWRLQAWVLAILPAMMLFTAAPAHRRACLVREAKRDPFWQDRNRQLDAEAAGRLRVLVTRMFSQLAPKQYESRLAQHARDLWLEIRKTFPGPGRTVALLAGYLAVIVLLVPLTAGIVWFYYPPSLPSG